MSAQPKYEFPRPPLVGFALDLLLGRRRSFAHDSRRVMEANPYPRRIEGLDNVPAEGPFILTLNHYNRPGLRPYHCAMAISAALLERRPGQPEVRWAYTSELRGQRLGPVSFPLWLVRFVFRRVARMYDLVVLPRRDELVMGRAAALHRLAHALASAPIGLAPEAAGSGRLIEPPVGSGLLLMSLAAKGPPIVPAGVWEEGRTLCVRFGEPFRPSVPEELPRRERDRAAREQVMVAIGRLLPREYWGAYAEAIERAVQSSPRKSRH